MTVEKIIKSVATLTVVAAVLFAIGYLWKVVLYVIVAAVLAIVGRPLVTRLVKFSVAGRVMSRSVAAAITLLSMWIVFGVLCWLFIPLLFGKVNELAVVEWEGVTAVIESTLSDFELLVERIFSIDITDIGLTFKRFVLGLVDVDYVKTFANVASAISSAAIAFFSISFITFYFLKEDGLFYRLVALFFPDRYRTNVFNALNSITTLLSRYFGGLMVESLLLMTIISIAMMLFGMAIGDALPLWVALWLSLWVFCRPLMAMWHIRPSSSSRLSSSLRSSTTSSYNPRSTRHVSKPIRWRCSLSSSSRALLQVSGVCSWPYPCIRL